MSGGCKLARGVASGVAVRGVQALRPQTEAVIGQMAQTPGAAQAGAMDQLISALAAAEIWPRLDALFVMAAGDEQAAGVNWAQPQVGGLSPVNSPVFVPWSGYEGDGATSFLETGFLQGGGLYQAADHHAGVWAVAGDSAGCAFGNSRNRIHPRSGAGQATTRSNCTANRQVGIASGFGHTLMSRRAADVYQVLKDGVLISEPAEVVTTVAAQRLILHGYAASGTEGALSSWRLAAAHFGAGLNAEQGAALHAALGRYLAEVGSWA